MITIQAHAFLTYQRDTQTQRGIIMKPILGSPNVIIIIKPPQSGDAGGDMAAVCWTRASEWSRS